MLHSSNIPLLRRRGSRFGKNRKGHSSEEADVEIREKRGDFGREIFVDLEQRLPSVVIFFKAEPRHQDVVYS
jgi:hypothetical protein